MATSINLIGVHELDLTLPGTTTATISAGIVSLLNAGFNGVNNETGNYTIQSSDNEKLVAFASSSALTATLPQPGTAGIDSHFVVWITSTGTGTLTITPVSATIDGAANLALSQNQGVAIFTDGTNYFTVRGVSSSPASVKLGSVGVTVDGGGSVPSTGIKGFIKLPYSCTVLGWTIMADQSGSAVFDVKYAATVGGIGSTTSITGTAQPTLTSAQAIDSTTLTGWTTTLPSGALLEFDLTSATTVTRVTLEITLSKT